MEQLIDPNLTSGQLGSGVLTQTVALTQTVQVRLINRAGDEVAANPAVATLNGNNWSAIYPIQGHRPSGRYTVTVTAEDKVGNRGTSTVGTIRIDAQPPKIDARNIVLPNFISNTLTINNKAIELPHWAGSVAQFHFESTPSLWADSSGGGQNGSCSNCPASTVSGVRGGGLTFAGTNQYMQFPNVVNTLKPFSAAVWFRPTNVASNQALLTTNSDDLWLYISGGLLKSDLGGTTINGVTPITVNQWHLATITFDGTHLTLYLDGVLEKRVAQVAGAQANSMLLGIGSDLTTDPFVGTMDELVIFAKTLSAGEILALSAQDISGIDKVKVRNPFW